MIFDVEKSLSLPVIRKIVNERDNVIKRFRPLFRSPSELARQDYLDFLSFQHNHHWTGLERLGRRAADDMENLRGALSILVDEASPLSERFDAVLARLHGVGHATLTPILLLAYPDRYGVWNGTSEADMRTRGLWPAFPRGSTQGEKYKLINEILLDLATQHKVDLWTLDALWWMSQLAHQNTGHYKDKWDIAIWTMADQAEQTARQANGQVVERIVKNKELRLSKQALIELIEQLLKENGYRCAITGIDLQPDGPDVQLRPSLDRIDSNGHYEIDNLQVVARFINFWKQDTPDAEFRRLLNIARGE